MNKCFRCGRKLKNSETTSGLEFCEVCEKYEQQLAKKDKEIHDLKELRKIEVEDKKELRQNRLQEIIELQEHIKEQDEALARKDKEIGKLIRRLMATKCKDKEIKELRNRVAELEDKDWYELCIKQLEEQNNKLIKERDELAFEKRNVFGLIEQMELKAIGVTKEKILAIRRQVCNEIKTLISEEYDIQDIYERLDKMAKGE